MPDASIKGIEFAVQGSTNGASKAIDRLVGKMAKLQSVLGNTKSANGYSRSMQSISKATSKTLSKFSKAIVATPIKALTDRVKSATGALSKLGAAFKRIVFYRFIRSVVREIGDAFKYGVNNLYAWSQAADGRFAASMDRISTAFAYFKNSIGAAVAPLINALAPAIDYVIDKAVALLNVINQLFARLTGATYWTKAIKQANAYGDAASSAGGAAKEALRYLAPFDELNVLPSDNGSGGGGGGGGSSGGGLFEIQQDFSESISNFAQMVKDAWDNGDWEEVGRFLGGKINDLIENLPWATMGANVGKFINALFGTAYWTLDTVNFTNLGKNIATFVNNAISNIDWDIAGRLSVKQFTVILDTIIGFIEGLDWGLVASSISDFIIGAFDEFSGWLQGVDFVELGTSIFNAITDAVAGIDWAGIASSMFTLLGSAIRAVADFGIGIGAGIVEKVKTWWENDIKGADFSETASNLWSAFKTAFSNAINWTFDNVTDPLMSGIFGEESWAGVKQTFSTAFDDLKTSLSEGWETFKNDPTISKIADFFSNPIGAIDDGIANLETQLSNWWTLVKAWFSDYFVRGLAQIGIDAANGLVQPIETAVNNAIDKINTLIQNHPKLAEFFGFEELDHIELTLIPNLDPPVGTFYRQTKDEIEEASKKNPTEIDSTANLTGKNDTQLDKTIPGMTAGFGVRKIDSTITRDPVTGFTAGLSKWTPSFSTNPWVYADTYGKYFYRSFDKYPWVYADTYGKYFYRSFDKYPWVYADTYGKYFYRSFDSYPWVYADTYGKYFYRSFDSYPWVYADTYGKYWHSAFSSTPWVDAGASFYTYSRDWSGAPWVNVSASVMALGGSLTTSRTTVGAIANPTGFASGGVMTKRFWKSLPKYAQGTRDAHGSLFVAGEAGPEVLGHIGGRTEVLNQSQLAATMFAAVKNAMAGIRFTVSGETQTYDTTEDTGENTVRAIITALQTLGLTGDALDNVQAHISSQEVYDSVRESNRRNTRMTGVNAFA